MLVSLKKSLRYEIEVHREKLDKFLLDIGAIYKAPQLIETKNLNLTMDMSQFGELYKKYKEAIVDEK
jgi:hypothetical protein